MKQIIKRDGTRQKFDKMKIVDAVLAAFREVDGKETEYALIKAGNIADYIADIAEKIAGKEECRFIMIAGPSSSGKTTFSHRLSVQLKAHGLRPHPIPVDNYFLDREQSPRDENGNYN